MKKVLIAILLLVIILNSIPINEFQAYAGSIEDYRNAKVPKGVIKPIVGMKLRINHQDGTVSEQWVTGNAQYEALQAKVGDTVTITDWSNTGSGDSLKRWDFQYVTPSGAELARYMSASQDGKIDSFSLDEAGTYEFYLSVEDDNTVGEWQNWSDNGYHEAQRELSSGKTYIMYFVRLDIEVEDVLEDQITINYLEKGTNTELLPSVTETMALGENTYPIPDKDSYTFDEWIFDNNSPSEADPVKVISEGKGEHYILNIYYTSDASTQVKAVIDGPNEVERNKSFELDGTKSYTSPGTTITEYIWEARPVSESRFQDVSTSDKFTDKIDEVTEYRLTVKNDKGDTDSVSHYVRLTGPPGDDRAYLDFEISNVIEKRSGGIKKGVYDSNFDIVKQYIESYEDDPPLYGIQRWEIAVNVEGFTIGAFNYTESDVDDDPQNTILRDIDKAITSWANGKAEGDYSCMVYMDIYGKGQHDGEAEGGIIRVTSGGGSDPEPADDYVVKINAYDENGNRIDLNISPNPIEFDTDGDKTVPVVSLDNYILKKVILSNLGADGNLTKEITNLTVLDDGNFNFTVSYDGDTTFTLVKAENIDVNLELDRDRLTVEYHFERDKSAPSSLSLNTSKDEAQINETVSYTVRQNNLEELKVYRKEVLHSQKAQLMTGTTFTSQYPKSVYIVGVGKGNFVDENIYLRYAVEANDEGELNASSPLDILTIDDLENMVYYDLQPLMNISKDEMNISIDPSTVEWFGNKIRQKWSHIHDRDGRLIDDKHIYSYRSIKLKVDSSYWYAYDNTRFSDDSGAMYSDVKLEVDPKKQKTGDMVTLIPTLLNTHNEKYSHGENRITLNKVPLADQEIHGLEFTSDDEGEQVAVVVAKGNFFKSTYLTVYSNSASNLINQTPEQIQSLSAIRAELQRHWEERLGNSNFNITLLPETYVWRTDIDVGAFDNDNPVYYKYSRGIKINYTIDTDYDYSTVEFTDDLELGKIIIECRDSATDGLIKTVNKNGVELNKNITVDAPTVSGYDFDPSQTSSPQTVKLTDSEKEKTVTFYYTKGSPDPVGGSGEIVFNPNSSDLIPGNREDWVNQNINVTVSIAGDKTAERSSTAPRAYTYEEEKQVEDGVDEDGNTKYKTVKETKNDIASCSFTETWEVGTISVTGSATGTVSGMNGGDVTITTEGDNLKLSATLNEWVSKEKVWGSDSAPNGGSWTEHGTPSGNTTPPDLYSGTSGIYKLDKTNPNSSSSIPSRDWTNIPYSVNITATDNLSGFWNSESYYNVSDRSYYNRNQANQYFTKGRTSETKTININQNGVYSINVILKDIAKNIMTQRTYGEYKFDNINPYIAQFDIIGCSDVVQRNIPGVGNGYQYMADYDNKIRVTIGDELSGLIDTKFSITKTSSFPSLSSMKNLNEGTGEAIAGSITKTFYINLNAGSTKESIAATEFNELKEGLWYVHIYQRDRAGNITQTTSSPLFINKIRDLRITKIADYNWKKYFKNPDDSPAPLALAGIPTKDMPVYNNNEKQSIKLGYKVYFKFDTVGFDEGDNINIKAKFYALEKDNTLLEVDLYVEDDNSGEYKPIENSGYNTMAYNITLDRSKRSTNEKTSHSKYNTWEFNYFIPPTTKAVKKGLELDLVNKNYKTYKLLTVFEITGNKNYGSKFYYTTMEDKWGTDDGSQYGRNRGTNLDLGFGVNHGEVFWYNLYESLMDDFKLYREW